MLNLHPIHPETRHSRANDKKDDDDKPVSFNTNSLLFPYTVQVFYAFHLLYEDLKLNTLLATDLKPLSEFLYQISKDLCLEKYMTHYWLDFPVDYSFECDGSESQMDESILKKLTQPNYFNTEPPNIFNYIDSMFKDVDAGYYPFMLDVNNMSRDIIEVSLLLLSSESQTKSSSVNKNLRHIFSRKDMPQVFVNQIYRLLLTLFSCMFLIRFANL